MCALPGGKSPGPEQRLSAPPSRTFVKHRSRFTTWNACSPRTRTRERARLIARDRSDTGCAAVSRHPVADARCLTGPPIGLHPRYHLHVTPTSSSWLNQVETWFSVLMRRQLRHGLHAA